MNRNEIMQKIPHRGTMLLLDSVISDGNTAIGIKQIRSDDSLLIMNKKSQIYPAFLFPELMAQTALFTTEPEGKIPFLTSIQDCIIHDYAFPGDILQIKAVSVYDSGSSGKVKCCILCENRIIAEGKILYCLKEGNET